MAARFLQVATVTGMHDVLGATSRLQSHVVNCFERRAHLFGFEKVCIFNNV